MSARSSSGSWPGGGSAAPDIIDLDKFMRGSVRPSRRIDCEAWNLRCVNDKLVVDAGGVQRKLAVLGSLGGSGAASGPDSPGSAPGPPVTRAAADCSSSSDSARPPHAKRYSHDSGLSDGSYARRKHRSHRRAGAGGEARAATGGTTDSLRAFRAVCERALLDQQAQIARVAQLCERLTERPKEPLPPPALAAASTPAPATGPSPAPTPGSESTSPHTSDDSSTSRSSRSRDRHRKDKHRTEECKTYKIIMTKLDELNRMFLARGCSPVARPAPLAIRRPAPSSGSVSMSDKVVATEPALLQTFPGVVARRDERSITNACTLDIAPDSPQPQRHNTVTESVVKCDSGPVATCACSPVVTCTCDALRAFEHEDPPMHQAYSQASRLRVPQPPKRRAHSVDRMLDDRCSSLLAAHVSERAGVHAGCHESHETSLCALCRGYWRSLRQYLATQIFCHDHGGQ